jgi:hypothetical protein
MITCHKRHFLARCAERGYAIEQVMPSVVAQDGDTWTIDPTHPAYPADRDTLHDYQPIAKFSSGMVVYRCSHCGGGVASKTEPRPAACPRRKKPATVAKAPQSGPGTELKKLLSRIGITASPTCSCNRRAREMDARGSQWCRENLDLIAGEWLAGEAKKRGLPYSVFAGKKLVQLAIALADRAAEKAKN